MGVFQAISNFTVGAMDDIWDSVNYAQADPFSCSTSFTANTKAENGIWILSKPIPRNATAVSFEGYEWYRRNI